MWYIIYLIRDGTHVICIGRQTQPLDHQGSLWKAVRKELLPGVEMDRGKIKEMTSALGL